MQTAINQVSWGADKKDGGKVERVEKTNWRSKENADWIVDYKSFRNLESTVTRWQKATKMSTGPLKSYAKQILEEQKQAYA